MCDQHIENGVPTKDLVATLLEGCENLAMIGLIVGLLVRHLEDADDALDPYLTEPIIWQQEFARVVREASPLAPDSKELVAPERRKWSLRDAAMFMVVQANGERTTALRALGETLIANARRLLESRRELKTTQEDSSPIELIDRELAPVRSWASSLDRDRYTAHEAPDGIYIQPTPSDDVVHALADSNEDFELANEATRLVVRLPHQAEKRACRSHRTLTSWQPTCTSPGSCLRTRRLPAPMIPWTRPPWLPRLRSNAHILEAAGLPDDALSFAVETVLRIGEGVAGPQPYEFEGTFWDRGADRSAARVLPLLLLPVAVRLRAVVDQEDGSTTFEHAFQAGVNLARAGADEVRLNLARGLDHVWKAPCAEHGRCHHELGWQIVSEAMRRSVLGVWEPDSGQRSVVALKDPLTESLANAAADSIIVSRLDGAIRALAPAAIADICVSVQACDLLLALFAAQRRSLLGYEHGSPDERGTHTLVSARALLTLAKDGDDTAMYEHIDAYADNSGLLDNLLRALSAAAEETPDRAATARRDLAERSSLRARTRRVRPQAISGPILRRHGTRGPLTQNHRRASLPLPRSR